MDFTIPTYKILLQKLLSKGFLFQSFADFILSPNEKVIVLRHDVDLLPQNSLEFARIQAEENIRGSYYFRFVPQSYNASIIKEIHNLGHEIGYHYETMDTCFGNTDQAYNLFCANLEKMRRLVPVKTICMHGSPMSKYDNRRIWLKYDYRKLGLIGEPYFDVDFEKVFYLTDTGRRWDGGSVSIRDKPEGMKGRGEKRGVGGRENLNPIEKRKVKPFNYKSGVKDFNPLLSSSPPLPLLQSFHTTFDIIKAARENKLPDQIMMTFHPQRWNDKPLPWVRELVWQNVKNIGKYFLVKTRGNHAS